METTMTTSATPNATSPLTIVGFFHNFGGNLWHLIVILAHYLHTTPAGAIALLIFLLIVLIFIIIVLCIRHQNKKRKKTPGQRVDLFDDLPFPDFSDSATTGSHLFFSLNYNSRKKSLRIAVSHASGLTSYATGSVDPYVIMFLVEPLEVEIRNPEGELVKQPPEQSSEFKKISSTLSTRVIENTSQPVFNEIFHLKASIETVSSKWLLFLIFDYDDTGRDSLMGRVILRLNQLEPSAFFGTELELDEQVEKCPDDMSNGDVCMVVRYIQGLPDSSMEFKVLEMRSLNLERGAVNSKARFRLSFCVYKKKKKVKNYVSAPYPVLSRNPYFNCTFRFSYPDVDLRTFVWIKITLFIMQPPLMIRRTVGVLKFGGDVENPPGKAHWKEALRNPLRPCARWHPFM